MPSFSDWGTILTSMYTAGVLEIQPAFESNKVFLEKKNINGGKLQLKYSIRFFNIKLKSITLLRVIEH